MEDPNVALKVYLWTHYDRLEFAPFEYRSGKCSPAAWTANGGALIYEAVNEAIMDLARQVAMRFAPEG